MTACTGSSGWSSAFWPSARLCCGVASRREVRGEAGGLRHKMNAVEIQGVWKYFGDYPALRDVTLSIPRGTCLALLGRNGAGKTTLLRILAGLSRPAKGTVSILGADARGRAVRSGVGVLGHGIGVYEELSAFENLRLFARLYALEDPDRTAVEWLERTGLERVRDGLVREFSR